MRLKSEPYEDHYLAQENASFRPCGPQSAAQALEHVCQAHRARDSSRRSEPGVVKLPARCQR